MSRYLSVSEYAKKHGKDVGNVRRLLASGRIEGQKVGVQWIISEDVPYPRDRRRTTGKYRNFRQRTALNRHKELMHTITHMINEICIIYGRVLSEVILYGSYARGEQGEDSDVDIALILCRKPSKQKTDAMIECVAMHELECGKVLSVIEVDLKMYSQWKDTLPFYKNIYREGIVLWKKAA